METLYLFPKRTSRGILVSVIGKVPVQMLPQVHPGSPGQAIVEPHFPDCPEGKYAAAPGNPGFA